MEEFYAHGLAIEREAMERYAEFAAHFAGQGEDVLSRLCATLARFEGEHYQDLLRASKDLELPMIRPERRSMIASAPFDAIAPSK